MSRVGVRCFVVTGGHKGVLCTAALRKEEAEELHLGFGWRLCSTLACPIPPPSLYPSTLLHLGFGWRLCSMLVRVRVRQL